MYGFYVDYNALSDVGTTINILYADLTYYGYSTLVDVCDNRKKGKQAEVENGKVFVRELFVVGKTAK